MRLPSSITPACSSSASSTSSAMPFGVRARRSATSTGFSAATSIFAAASTASRSPAGGAGIVSRGIGRRSSVVISNGGGIKQYVQFIGRGVVGVAADDGRFLWGYNKIANNVANIPTPLVQDDYVFCSSGYQTGAALLKLNASGNGVEAEEVYFLDAKKLQNQHGGLVMVGDYVYGGHGHKMGAPTCLEWKTGEIKWRKERGPGEASAAVAYADGNLYFRYENGLVALIGAGPDSYELKGTFKIPDVEKPSWPHPVVVGGKLYLREQNRLYCYDVSAK